MGSRDGITWLRRLPIAGKCLIYSLNKELLLCVSSFLPLQLQLLLLVSLLAVKPQTQLAKPVTQWLQTQLRSLTTQLLLLKKALLLLVKLLATLLRQLKKLLATLLLLLKALLKKQLPTQKQWLTVKTASNRSNRPAL